MVLAQTPGLKNAAKSRCAIVMTYDAAPQTMPSTRKQSGEITGLHRRIECIDGFKQPVASALTHRPDGQITKFRVHVFA